MRQLITSLARRTPVLDESVSYGTGSPRAKDDAHQLAKPLLPPEDRHDFERTLDEVLAADAPRGSEPLNSEQLRTMALTAHEAIAATAAPEYAHYIEVRERIRNASRSDASLATRASAERSAASVTAVMTVLVPVLFGTAAAIFLLVGYILKMLDPEPAFAQTLLTAGWLFGALTAAGVLLAMVGLLLTALRSTAQEDWAGNEELAAARDAWRQALRNRGIEPFLRDVRKAVSRGLDHDQAP
jgi:hypothetical protein